LHEVHQHRATPERATTKDTSMKFLGKMWNGVKSGFNWVKKHKVLTFMLGMGVVGATAAVMMGGAGLGGALAVGAGAAGVGALAFGGPFLIGGLAILAVMGIAGLFGAGGKKKEPEPRPPAVSPADPSAVTPITGLDDCPPSTGFIRGLDDRDPAATRGQRGTGQRGTTGDARGTVHDLDLTAAQRAPLQRRGPPSLGLNSVLAEENGITPTLIEDAPIPAAEVSPTVITDSPGLAPVGPTVDLPLGEPVG